MTNSEPHVTLTSEDLPLGAEVRQAGPVEHSGEIDLNEIPTRKERLGYGKQSKSSDYSKEVESWGEYVLCPVCGSQMTLLKGRKGRYGESLVYQCHTEVKRGQYCLAVMTLTVGSRYYMRPGDFEACDVGWEGVASETVEVREGDVIKQAAFTKDFELPETPPPAPWSREVQGKVVWDNFWEIALKNNGVVSTLQLIDIVKEKKPEDRAGKGLSRLESTIKNFPTFVTKSTGYLVRTVGSEFHILGKVEGDTDMYPYSDPEYRKLHQLERS